MEMAEASPLLDLWLIRTSDNFIAGPYTQEQIRQLIRERQLGLQDELCPANQYWIFLHETEELSRLLGADVLQWLSEDREDVTLTQTEPGLVQPQLIEKALAEGMHQGDSDGATTVMSRASQNTIQGIRPATPPAIHEPLIHISPSGAQGPFLKRYGWLLLVTTALAIVLAYQFL